MPIVARTAIGAIVGCLCAAVGHAEGCHTPSPPTAFPEPAAATEADMLTAQQNVKKYFSDVEEALKCFSAAHNETGYNHAVEDMERTAATFNGVLRAFRARQKA